MDDHKEVLGSSVGADFEVWTDTNPLSYLHTSTKLGSTETIWMVELSAFRSTVKYISGKSNQYADSLSRKISHGEEPASVLFEQILASGLKAKPRQTTLLPYGLEVRVQ